MCCNIHNSGVRIFVLGSWNLIHISSLIPLISNPNRYYLMEIQRISSLDRFLNTVSPSAVGHDSTVDIFESLHLIIHWWKRYSSLKKIQSQLLEISDDIHLILRTVSSLEQQQPNENLNFQQAQEIILEDNFTNSLSKFLTLLPRDPSLKTRNKQAKSVRFISSSLIIQRFPSEVLQDSESLPDNGIEAKMCIQAANLLIFSLKRFCSSLHASFHRFRSSSLPPSSPPSHPAPSSEWPLLAIDTA
jgi:hypothetical protein